MRLVLDTNVLVAAMRSPSGASAALLHAVRGGRMRPLATTALFLEYEAVLTRPEHLDVAGATSEDVLAALALLAAVAEPITPHFLWRPQSSDPDDDLVLDAAINGRANAIVTFEHRAFQAAQRFGIDVMTPAALWRTLRS